MPSHNGRYTKQRHGGASNTRARTTHGTGIDPTGVNMSMYGSYMDLEPITVPNMQGQWGGNEIADDAIGSEHLAALAILAEHLADNSVAQRHLRDAIVGTDELVALSVTTDKLAAFAVTAGKILAGTITADKIHADGLSANQIRSGTLSVGGLAGVPDYLNVYDDDGDLIAQFSSTRFILIDPDDADLAMRFREGVLEFTSNYSVGEELATWSTAISAAGIRADSIKVGIAPGGHNLVPNSSFESAPFSANLTKEWTVAADWGTTIGTDVNIDKSGNSLQLTDATY